MPGNAGGRNNYCKYGRNQLSKDACFSCLFDSVALRFSATALPCLQAHKKTDAQKTQNQVEIKLIDSLQLVWQQRMNKGMN
jgi:hypothetical protein